MINSNWIAGDLVNSYVSNHVKEKYLGDYYPKYHVFYSKENDGWVIGQFYPFVGEYVPFEEENEETLVFDSHKEAMYYVEINLIGNYQDELRD